MIGYLKGTPRLVNDKLLVVTPSGVGYEVSVGRSLLTKAQTAGELELYTHTHVKEDQLSLFGFGTTEEKKLFQLLLGVSGVGPSIALNISELGAERIISAVQEAQVSTFTAIPRVGKKLAQKIIIDLKSKLGSLKELELSEATGQAKELAEALMALGFDEQTSYQTAKRHQDDKRPIEVVLKEAIRELRT